MDQRLIRNFSIIAHIDHGKSTLADRMLQITGVVSDRDMRAQWKRQNGMLDNAREMAGRLSSLAEFGLRTTYTEFDGEDHGTMVPVALSRTVSLVLAGKAKQ